MNLDRFGFKAKTIDGNKQWGYGYFVPSKDDRRCLWYYDGGLRTLDIDPETICQCTGLEDSEGNLIYENDFLKITGEEGNIEKALVRYDENILEYFLIFNKSELPIRFMLIWLEEGKKCYIIGNKFDSEVENDKNLH